MNLYKLHSDAEQLFGYDKQDELAQASIKTVQDDETAYKNGFGQLHRLDGPAVTYDNSITEYWYKFDKRHRTDGPAVTYFDGDVEYWIDGDKISKNKFDERYG